MITITLPTRPSRGRREGGLLLNYPEVILDEPTEGIQPNVVAEIEQVIAELTRRGDLTVRLVEQHVGFALRSTRSVPRWRSDRTPAPTSTCSDR